jgi:CII-binding regulator of phage lambda lysogenization HflD
MRNNPKYIHYSSLSPYHYSMKSLLNTKKIQVLKVYGEEETLLRTILKERQNERTQNQEVISKEEERRKTLLKTLFYDWNVPERGWIQTKLVIIQSFFKCSR